MARRLIPPRNYTTPRFPSLNVNTLFDSTPDKRYTLYYIGDVWRFTVIWTLITFALFHLGAVFIALFTHGWKKSSWKYLWLTPIIYLGVAGLEALLSGTIVGVMSVLKGMYKAEMCADCWSRLGAVYQAGYYEMNTWIPCTWGFINVLTLIISSFSIQGGL
ncbi:hypothetical protein TGAM01_v201159 [Trichoderma gamsii]|uniref:Integral membrane protein n=1 Tax=Trichoderma gamsii TaxID=398673 RepID=A0A0W7VPD0_9HYPO|nr:hypothetical protein TGAM01_v201159 [Trichoderma gamsii]PNP37515.1 hypothetical protein TGAMA5MH_10618 [Trichoderma gamsii]PON29792.1 hypothetical protein TGAM01_v201159 [Trichoderma gamsii]